MRHLYWQPQRVSRQKLLLVAAMALAGFVAVEYFLVEQKQPHYDDKLRAAKLAQLGFEAIRLERQKLNIPIDREYDLGGSGLLGDVFTSITSGSGNLEAKQTSVNPNYAGLVVQWLKRLDLKEGDLVAVGLSGSFPATNICVAAALKTLKLKPLIISSTAGSQWGANNPDFTWLDMERTLREQGIFPWKSIAASRGGVGDRGLGLPKVGRQMLDAAIERNGVVKLEPKDDMDSVEQRLRVYQEAAGEEPIVAYINVGGGTVSVGTKVGKREYEPGVTTRPTKLAGEVTSVLGEFLKRDVPVVHIAKTVQLAQRYGFPVAPPNVPVVGTGHIFVRRQYNRALAGGVLLIIVGLAVWLARFSLRITTAAKTDEP